MKKVLCLLMVLTMAVGCISISASAAEYGTVLNNNVALLVGSTNAIAMNSLQQVPVAPVVVDNEVLIPLRTVSELFNGDVNYDAATGIIDIQFGPTKTVVLREGSKQYTVNGRAYNFDVAPQVVDGTTMVPLMALAGDIIGKSVFYDSGTGLIVISNRKVIKDSVTDAAVISVIASAISSGNVPEISVPTSYQLDWGYTDGTGGAVNSNYDVGQLKFVSLNASSEPESNNPASNVNDGSIGTFWAIGDVGGDIICDLGKINAITEIKVGFAKSSERAANYEVWVSTDNSNYQQVFAGASTQGQPWASHSVSGAYRYVKVVSNGNSTGSTWNSIAEIQAYNNAAGNTGSTTVTTYEALKPTSIVASSEPEAENNASKVNDDDPGTFWAANGACDITLDLGSAKTVSSVIVQMRAYDDGRCVNYGVSYSADGASYTSVFDGTSEPGGSVQETHDVGASARYIKVNVNGSSTNDWASVAEIIVNGAATTTTTTTTTTTGGNSLIKPASIVASSEPEAENNASKVNDEDPGTFWAANGACDITLDLGSVQTVNSVMVQMRAYDDGRSVNYGVSYSADGTNYTSAFDGTSEPGGSVREDHNIGASARYIKVNVNGSSTNDWASVAEIEVYGVGTTTTTTNTVEAQSTGALQNMSSVSGTFVLAVQGTSNVLTVSSDNSSLTLTANSDDSKQKWTKDGDGVKNNGVGYYLDVFNQSYDEGGQIGVWEGNGGDNQKWTFENKGDYYLIRSNMSGLYLSAVGNSIQQRIENDATKWVVSDGTIVSTGSASVSNATAGLTNLSSVSDNFIIAVQGTSNVLTVDPDTSTISLGAYVQSNNQQWSMDGESIKNNGTKMYMNVSNRSYNVGSRIDVKKGSGDDNQKWTLENKGSYYLIKNNMSGLYVSIEGNSVVQSFQSGASKWVISDAGTAVEEVTTAESGSFANMTSINGSFVMAVQGTNNVLTVGSDNFTLSVSAYTNDSKQQWSKDGDAVKNNGTGIYMDVSGQSYDAGAQICVWEGNGGDNQKWTFENQGDYYLIKSNMSGLYLSVVGSDVQQQSMANATKWVVAAK